MTVRIDGRTIYLEGRCLAEDAEDLILALREAVPDVVDVSRAQRLHMAVVQVLLVFRPRLHGTPANPFLTAHVMPTLQS